MAAISGANSPLSPASSASRPIAEMRTLTLADAGPLAWSSVRYLCTAALVNGRAVSAQSQIRNPSRACA
jgi:voltage-gated potassium channel Kch